MPSGTWQTPGLSIPWGCLPTSSSVCLLPPFTVPWKMVLARPDERDTWTYHCSLRLFTMVRRLGCLKMARGCSWFVVCSVAYASKPRFRFLLPRWLHLMIDLGKGQCALITVLLNAFRRPYVWLEERMYVIAAEAVLQMFVMFWCSLAVMEPGTDIAYYQSSSGRRKNYVLMPSTLIDTTNSIARCQSFLVFFYNFQFFYFSHRLDLEN